MTGTPRLKRLGLPLQVAGLVVSAAGLALLLTAVFMTVATPLSAPGAATAAGGEGVTWTTAPLHGEPTLPRVVTPGQGHDVYAERIVARSWDPRVASAEVQVYLILSPPGAPVPETPVDAGPGDWVLVERHSFTEPGEAWDARLRTDFATLPAPDAGYPEGWSARVGRVITYRYVDGATEPVATPGDAAPAVQVGSALWGRLFPTAAAAANVLSGAALIATGAAVWWWGLKRYRRESLVVRIRPAVLSGGPRAS